MNAFNDERGQTLVLVSLGMVMLMGFVALAIDVGILYRAKRNMQIVADAVAIAGAHDYFYNKSLTSALSAAQEAAVANGVTNGSNGAVVTVNCSPASGPNTGGSGCNGFFEAIVSTPNPTYFMRLYKFSSIRVAARAVAGTPAIGNFCMWAMNSSASSAFYMQGTSATINAPNCGIYVNSSSGSAVTTKGNPQYNGPALDVVGGLSGHGTSPTPVTTGVASTSPSIGTNIFGPDPSSACSAGNTFTGSSVTKTATLPSAANGVVCFSSNVTINDGVKLPGSADGTVYLFKNGLVIPVNATVTFGSASYDSSTGTFSNTLGATIDLYGVGSSAGTLDQKSNSVLNVYAPTSGAYNSIAIMEPPSNTTTLQVQFGSNNEVFDGIIYAPKAEVYLQDHGGGVTASGIIADTIYIKASTTNIPSYNNANQNTTPFKVVTLVE